MVLHAEGGGLGVLLRLLLAATRVPRAVSFVCDMVSGWCVCMVMVHGIGDGGAGGSRSKEGGGHVLSEVGSVSCSGGNSSGAASNKSCSDVESRNGGA